jgi:hypothetical protein
LNSRSDEAQDPYQITGRSPGRPRQAGTVTGQISVQPFGSRIRHEDEKTRPPF